MITPSLTPPSGSSACMFGSQSSGLCHVRQRDYCDSSQTRVSRCPDGAKGVCTRSSTYYYFDYGGTIQEGRNLCGSGTFTALSGGGGGGGGGGGEPGGGGGSATVTYTLKDACADGTGVDYRFYAYRPDRFTVGQSVRAWPSRSTHWTLTGYGDENSHRLTCTPGHRICNGGARADGESGHWGVGLRDDASLTSPNACTTCPPSGNRNFSSNFTCS